MVTIPLDTKSKHNLENTIITNIFSKHASNFIHSLNHIALENSDIYNPRKTSSCFMYKNKIYPIKTKGETAYPLHESLIKRALDIIDVFDQMQKAVHYMRFILSKVAVLSKNYADYVAFLPEYLQQFLPENLLQIITIDKIVKSNNVTDEKIQAFHEKIQPYVNKHKEYLVSKAFIMGT